MPCLRLETDHAIPLIDEISAERTASDYFDGTPAALEPAGILKALKYHAPLHEGMEKTVHQVIHSALANPGGLIRYRLAYFTAMAHAPDADDAPLLACAIEYFHLASLLFDDLPVMDDAMERRGRICLHLLHGDSPVILGALSLITRAYALIGRIAAAGPLKARLAIHAQVERCLGGTGIINGQARDLTFTPASRGLRGPIGIALGKTVPLLTMAMVIPARLAGSPEGLIQLLRRLSIYWGLYYQGVDDLKDLLERTETSGKTSGRDQALSRPNIAHQLGVSGTRSYLLRLACLAGNCVAEIIASHPQSRYLPAFQMALLQRLESLPQ
jgi:geranylgeranyl pyrophosphate synthase